MEEPAHVFGSWEYFLCKAGSALRSTSDMGQINEALCKILAHNTCVLIQAMHALNIHPIFRDVQMSAGVTLEASAPL